MTDLFPWTERDLLDRLRDHLPAPAWAYVEHVRYELPSGPRTLDALAMDLHSGSDGGLSLHGFEVKTSRADWLRELGQPAKAEAFTRHVDYFWLVAPVQVTTYEELPDRWGLLVPHGSGFYPVRDAVQLRPQLRSTPFAPVDRQLVAALLRSQIRAMERATGARPSAAPRPAPGGTTRP